MNQVENIYWGLVSAYEDEQAKERALAQSTQLTADNRKQLEIGTLAPLDVVNSDTCGGDGQAGAGGVAVEPGVSAADDEAGDCAEPERSRNSGECAGDSDGPRGLDRLPEEDMPVEDLVKQAYVEQSAD